MTIELIFDADCPNVDKSRANLIRALGEYGFEGRWTEWTRSASDSPSYAKEFGSPTVLVDGQDVAGQPPGAGSSCCRLYRREGCRLDGAPSVEQITEALRGRRIPPPGAPRGSSSWKGSLAMAPGIVFAFLPKLACPACWPAYAGLLSSVGLGFLLDVTYLFPITAGFLVLAVGALALSARLRGRYGPFTLGLAAAILVLVGKFVLNSDNAMYGGISVLIAASIWNAWPISQKGTACPACVTNSSSTVPSQ